MPAPSGDVPERVLPASGGQAIGIRSGGGPVTEPATPTAAELAGGAELLVRQAERVLAVAEDPTARDVAETELQAALELQDQVMDRRGLRARARGAPGLLWVGIRLRGDARIRSGQASPKGACPFGGRPVQVGVGSRTPDFADSFIAPDLGDSGQRT